MPSIYTCPICSQTLNLQDKTWSCENHHSFDQHKKGYINLLTVQRRRSKAPGDNLDMVKNRRFFLQSGHYLPLAQYVAERCQQYLPRQSTLLDAGCGEGYYTNEVKTANDSFECYGIDISKSAIQQAASSYKNIQWCVGSSAHPPYQLSAFDSIISIFSRIDIEPFAKILKPGGFIIMVAPDANHLQSLRQLIYQTVIPYDTSKHKNYFDARFTLLDETALSFDINLSSQAEVQSLLGMTPHAHRLDNKSKQKIAQLQGHQDSACFKVYCFKLERAS